MHKSLGPLAFESFQRIQGKSSLNSSSLSFLPCPSKYSYISLCVRTVMNPFKTYSGSKKLCFIGNTFTLKYMFTHLERYEIVNQEIISSHLSPEFLEDRRTKVFTWINFMQYSMMAYVPGKPLHHQVCLPRFPTAVVAWPSITHVGTDALTLYFPSPTQSFPQRASPPHCHRTGGACH